MKIAITGAGGTVGRVLCDIFTREGHEVVGIVRPRSNHALSCLRLVHCDLGEEPPPREYFDVIVHAAAHTPQSTDQSAEKYFHSNVSGMKNLCTFAKDSGAKLVVNFSTVSVYGTISVEHLTETTPFDAPNVYGETKYQAECILADSGIPSLTIRLPGVVGPGCLTSWIGQVLLKLSKGEEVTIFNPHGRFNNIVDTRDLSLLVQHFAMKIPSKHEVFLVSTPEPIQIEEVVQTMAAEIESKSRIKVGESTKPPFTIDNGKLRTFGFTPSPTREVIQRFIDDNRERLRNAR